VIAGEDAVITAGNNGFPITDDAGNQDMRAQRELLERDTDQTRIVPPAVA